MLEPFEMTRLLILNRGSIRFKKIGCLVQSADISSGSLSGSDRQTGKPKVNLVASLQESNGI